MTSFKEIDAPGNLVHGTYLENLPRILRARGLFPSDTLPEYLKPLRSYKRRQIKKDKGARSKTRTRMISTVVLYDNKYGYDGSLREQKLWGDPALFHFHIVSNYDFRSLSKSSSELYIEFGGDFDTREYNKPYYTEDSEVALVNQGLPIETFIAFVVPTDSMIQNHTPKTLRQIFESRMGGKRHIMTAQEIAGKLSDKLSIHECDYIPIFYFNGRKYFR